jgi:ABC-2 type transport system permease protein
MTTAGTTARVGTRVAATADSLGPLTGTWQLVRLALRRDRVMLPLWIAVFVVTAASSAAATVGLYPDLASRAGAAATINENASLVALYGRVYDTTSLGAISMIKMGGLGAALVAVLAIVVVVRHTRAEEEAGRLELVGATVVGRHASLAAAVVVSLGANLALGLLSAAGLAATGLPPAGSLLFGLAWAGTGLAFAAVAAVTAQLATVARTATAAASAVLGLTYLLRAVGDTAAPGGPRWASWLSPVGWGQQVRPFAGDRWGVLGLLVLFSAVTFGLAFSLSARRDHGAGLIADRPGPAGAAAALRGPTALAWRLQRGLLLGWVAGFVLVGAVLGNIASNVSGFLDSPAARDIFLKLGGAKGLTDAFLAAEIGIMSLAVAVFGVQAVMRAHSEEAAVHAEPLLATGVSRGRWLLSHVGVAVLGSALLLCVAGLAAGAAHAANVGAPGEVWRVLGAAVAQLPAVLVVVALAVAAFGLVPRAVTVGWAALVAFFLVGELGPLFNLSQWVMDLSPFAHSPRLPGGPVSATPLVVLSVIALGLVVTGFVGFRRRDVG